MTRDRRYPASTPTGSVWMDTQGSEFDTVLSVFGTDPPESATRVAENDNASSRPGATLSAVRFAAVAGQTYLIRVCQRTATDPDGTALRPPAHPPAALSPRLQAPRRVHAGEFDRLKLHLNDV